MKGNCKDTAAVSAASHKESSAAARKHSPRMLSTEFVLANISFLDLYVLLGV